MIQGNKVMRRDDKRRMLKRTDENEGEGEERQGTQIKGSAALLEGGLLTPTSNAHTHTHTQSPFSTTHTHTSNN